MKTHRIAAIPGDGIGVPVTDAALAVAAASGVRLEAGTVWINRYGRSRDHILPTGGYKASGLGKDLGREAYHANRRSKSVLIDIAREAA